MSYASQTKRIPKTHMLGSWAGGGFRRTLCEHASEGLLTTSEPSQVTCATCVWRIAKKEN